LVWQLLFLGLALGTNNALASIALGTSGMPRSRQFTTAVIFGIFEAIMPILGIWIGGQVAGVVGDKAKIFGIAILVLVALWALLKKPDKNEGKGAPKSMGSTMILAIALSLDNLSIGFGLGMLQVPLVLAAIIFGLVSLVMTFVGLEIGRFLGSRMNVSADKLSGAVLLVVAGFMIFV
jgi:manganese efflux pump family protein